MSSDGFCDVSVWLCVCVAVCLCVFNGAGRRRVGVGVSPRRVGCIRREERAPTDLRRSQRSEPPSTAHEALTAQEGKCNGPHTSERAKLRGRDAHTGVQARDAARAGAVLMAMDIITKDKKHIKWKGFPQSWEKEREGLERRVEEASRQVTTPPPPPLTRTHT
eukprot:2718483-Rhodomonas_salina.2